MVSKLRRFGAWLAFSFVLTALLLASAPGAAAQKPAIELYYFYDPVCSSCDTVQREILAPLQAEYGERLVIVRIDMTETANFEMLLALEAQYGVASGGIPEIFIGDYALSGEAEIRAALKTRIAEYADQGVSLAAVTPLPSDSPTAAATPIASGGGVTTTSPVNLLLFYSPTCSHCHEMMTEVLPPIMAKYGDKLQVRVIDVTHEPGNDFWHDFMTLAGVQQDAWYVPMTVVGDRIMIGAESPRENLDGLIDAFLQAGEVWPYPLADRLDNTLAPVFTGEIPSALSDTPAAEVGPAAPIHAAYFFQDGCDVCERAERDLAYIQQKYPQLVLRRINIAEGGPLNTYLSERSGVPEARRMTAPALFIGDSYLLGEDVRAPGIQAMLQPYLESGAPEPWAGYDEAAATSSIVERFRSFGLLAVIGAGLLDGVNPCAFATIIFLLSYLAVRKRTGKALLMSGAAFTLGVFLTYLGVGFGLLKALTALPFLNAISKWLYGATALLCLVLAVGSLQDARKARQGKLDDMSLTLPDRLKKVSHKLIREGTTSRWLIPASLGLGLVVSLIELACTGQVYLPTIVFVLGVPELRTRAALTLILYNLMFIVPLVAVFLLVYFGTTSQQLLAWMRRNAALVKTIMAGFFVMMAVWLIYSIFA
ncbi:MAG: hypothetical protein GXY52_11915 [Chloroflexi bacterium]|nr:hypothetical protein [Chloroflexota bacterium]